MSVSASDFVSRVCTFVGVPFKHQGRNRFGVDCIGLPVAALAELGALPDPFNSPTNYGRLPSRLFHEELARWCTPAPRTEPGVLLLIQWPKVTRPSHCAVYTGETIVHAYHGSRGVIEVSYREPWLTRTVSAWQLPGVLYSGGASE
jgi:cell wall-associated NlpC family hydrolase